MVVNYDMSTQLCSSDFYGWLVEWTAKGASEIVFDTREFRSGWPGGVARQRFESMILPGPALIGLPSREGGDGERVGPRSKVGQLIAFARANKSFKRLRSVRPPGTDRFTVTIRSAEQDRWRNSNREAWTRFANEIGARIIEDYIVEPFHRWDLMALYAGAEMNFGVNCGPLFMCSLSAYPCMIFKFGAHRTLLEKSGARFGEQLPWCGENQFTFWDDDTFANINSRYREWR
jgi:hypothetical protein